MISFLSAEILLNSRIGPSNLNPNASRPHLCLLIPPAERRHIQKRAHTGLNLDCVAYP